ncbi:MAG: putative baseplate assembly protein, partial [Verrucomicrobiota bacterium]
LLAPTPDDVTAVRNEIHGKVLSVGIIPVPDPVLKILPEGGKAKEEERAASLVFDIPDVLSSANPPPAKYRRLKESTVGGANPLLEPSVVELELEVDDLTSWTRLDPLEPGTGDYPPLLDDEQVTERLVTWIRIGVAGVDSPADIKEKVGPNGGRIWVTGVNAAMATQRARIEGEFLGLGGGQPDQAFQLANTPVIAESVRLTVNGEPWSLTDDLGNAPGEVRRQAERDDLPTSTKMENNASAAAANVFTVDSESGDLKFGDGLRGRRPPNSAVVQVSYDYGGGIEGLVGIGAINKATSLPAGVTVDNPLPSWGGAEAENVAEAEKRIPGFLRHRDRLVSGADFREITFETPGVDMGRVEILPLLDPSKPTGPDVPGAVTVMVIPKYDLVWPLTPEPDHLFLERVCKHLQPRRLLTTELHIRGPKYKPVWISIGLDVVAGQEFAPVREEVKAICEQFLSALRGGFDLDGWSLAKPVVAGEMVAVAARVSGVSKVNQVLLGEKAGGKKDTIAMSGLELPRLMGIEVQAGLAQPLEDLRGDLGEVTEPTRFPVPVIPDSC